jgi:ABC-type uncharacterized transport system involved in gliding motility auxiliary subunit
MHITRRRALFVAVAVVVLAGVQLVAERTERAFDLTAERSLSLTRESQRIAQHVRRPVHITAFLRRTEGGRSEAAGLLDRFRRESRRISYRVVDPDDSPGEASRLDIDPLVGGLAMVMGRQVERAPTVTEQDVTAALARLERGRAATVCALAGHGEPALDSTVSDGLSVAAELLHQNGYRLQSVDLLVEPAVPNTCDAVLLVRPTAPLGEGERAISAFLAAGGRAVVLTDPVSTVDVNSMLQPYGLGIDRGIVVERDPDSHLPGDTITPVVHTYRDASPVARRLPPTLFPGVQRVTTSSDAQRGLSVAGFARTSAASFLSRQAQPAFDPTRDEKGPIVVAAAADRSRTEGGKVTRTRVVVTGDSDFASNAFIREAGNSRLLVQALDWATLQEDLVSVSANLPSLRPLALTDARRRYLLFLTAAVIPGLFLLGGTMVWAVRRRL